MAEIPTMECPARSGLGGFLVLVGRANWWRSRRWLYRSTADSLPRSYYEPHECRVWLAEDADA